MLHLFQPHQAPTVQKGIMKERASTHLRLLCTEWCLKTEGDAQTLDEAGEGQVIVVDGQASKRCALLGDLLAAKLHKNGFVVRLTLSHIPSHTVIPKQSLQLEVS